MTNPSFGRVDREQNPKSPPARDVAEFHRHADTDASKEAIHHTLGTEVYQAAAGNHTHDGTTGEALMDTVMISGNVSSDDNGIVIKKILTALSDAFGLTDNTTQI